MIQNLERDIVSATDGYLYIKDFLEVEVEKVIEFYSMSYSNNYIYLSTSGGENAALNLILDLINKNRNNTVLILNEVTASNGLVLYIMAECKKEIKQNSYGIAHLSSFETRITGYDMDSILSEEVEHLKMTNKKLIKMYEDIGVGKKLIDRMKNGEDILLDYKFLKRYTDEYNKKNKRLF